MSRNMQRLGNTLAGRMKQTADAAVPISLELGVVENNLSIVTDSLRTPIPKGEYMINLMLTMDVSSEIRKPQAGDRVLVAWCGNEPVVIAIVVSS